MKILTPYRGRSLSMKQKGYEMVYVHTVIVVVMIFAGTTRIYGDYYQRKRIHYQWYLRNKYSSRVAGAISNQ